MPEPSDDRARRDAPADAHARSATAAYEPAAPPPLRRPGTPAGAAPPESFVPPPPPPPRRASRRLLAALVVLSVAAAGLAYLRPWETRTDSAAPGALPRPGEGESLGRQQDDEATSEPEFSAGASPAPAATQEPAYELSTVTERPRPLNIAEVRRWMEYNYPPDLRDSRVEGAVQLRFRVGSDGRVEAGTARVSVSSNPAFDAVAIRAVEQLRFSPARVAGRPVRVWVELPIRFQVS